jgi:hypothetical protein
VTCQFESVCSVFVITFVDMSVRCDYFVLLVYCLVLFAIAFFICRLLLCLSCTPHRFFPLLMYLIAFFSLWGVPYIKRNLLANEKCSSLAVPFQAGFTVCVCVYLFLQCMYVCTYVCMYEYNVIINTTKANQCKLIRNPIPVNRTEPMLA